MGCNHCPVTTANNSAQRTEIKICRKKQLVVYTKAGLSVPKCFIKVEVPNHYERLENTVNQSFLSEVGTV